MPGIDFPNVPLLAEGAQPFLSEASAPNTPDSFCLIKYSTRLNAQHRQKPSSAGIEDIWS
jgi:hypothetical protein